MAGQDNCYVENKLADGTSNYVSIDKLRSTTLAKTDYAERDDVPEAFKKEIGGSNFFIVNYNDLFCVMKCCNFFSLKIKQHWTVYGLIMIMLPSYRGLPF
ncbi:hypothetical protein [Paraflavitalea speifideaquila]|uniref:hypothetical protein n=1 Tax=Paraflavitalea speifideaquila TaxID=3076558 RepID=UPI0028EC0F4C|nr:hypothetical protein [Paraflavitalea speifideiaquila]